MFLPEKPQTPGWSWSSYEGTEERGQGVWGGILQQRSEMSRAPRRGGTVLDSGYSPFPIPNADSPDRALWVMVPAGRAGRPRAQLAPSQTGS